MIVAAVGVPGITAIELALMFNNLKVNYGVVKGHRLVKFLENRSEDQPQPIFPVIFTSGTSLLRTYGKFGATKIIAFVLDSPIVLTKNLGLDLLGAECTKTSVSFSKVTETSLRELLIASSKLEETLNFSDRKYKPVDEILKRYEQSDLSKLQTFLYKIKELPARDKVSNLVKTWLMTAAPFSKIEGKLQRVVKPNVVAQLRVMLTDPSVDTLRLAIRQVKAGKLTPVTAAKKHKISAFDIRYLLATNSPT